MVAEMGWQGVSFGMEPSPSPDLHPCTGSIQPGALMVGGCTMNFIFRDPAGALYFGTAGHCAGGIGHELGVVGVDGQVAVVVYDGCALGPGNCTLDFALARIFPAFHDRVNPTVCHWGGPMDVNVAPRTGQTTHMYGQGSIYGLTSGTRARMGVLIGASVIEVTYLGFAQAGDSGSPVLSGDGRALGVHVRSSVFIPIVGVRVDPTLKYATRIDAAMAAAEAATGLDLSLVAGTAPFNLLGS